ncbi:MAG: metallophosphoesterase [Myxococcota bacterium]
MLLPPNRRSDAHSYNPARAVFLVAATLVFASACANDEADPEGASLVRSIARADPSGWTLVVLPDTQNAIQGFPEVVEEQARWIINNARRLNVVAVVHVGDITNDNSETQWQRARDALLPINDVAPLVMVTGNHDLGEGGSANERASLFSEFFPWSEFESNGVDNVRFSETSSENAVFRFETPTGPVSIVALEFGPRDEVVRWAKSAYQPLPGERAILVTHSYLYFDATRYDAERAPEQLWRPGVYGIASSNEGVNDGEQLFQNLIADTPEYDLVLSGHVLDVGVARARSEQTSGHVHEVVANYQEEEFGGNGFLRLMRFSADGSSVHVETYSPLLDEVRDDDANRFRLALD